MSVQRLVRIGVAGVFVMLCAPMQAATAAGAAIEAKAVADKQATALISPRYGEVVRPEANELTRTQLVTNRAAAGAAPGRAGQDATARADDEAADMAEREIYALIAACLIAVLSLSRRRNL